MNLPATTVGKIDIINTNGASVNTGHMTRFVQGQMDFIS
jgi:hypothetical protein